MHANPIVDQSAGLHHDRGRGKDLELHPGRRDFAEVPRVCKERKHLVPAAWEPKFVFEMEHASSPE